MVRRIKKNVPTQEPLQAIVPNDASVAHEVNLISTNNGGMIIPITCEGKQPKVDVRKNALYTTTSVTCENMLLPQMHFPKPNVEVQLIDSKPKEDIKIEQSEAASVPPQPATQVVHAQSTLTSTAQYLYMSAPVIAAATSSVCINALPSLQFYKLVASTRVGRTLAPSSSSVRASSTHQTLAIEDGSEVTASYKKESGSFHSDKQYFTCTALGFGVAGVVIIAASFISNTASVLSLFQSNTASQVKENVNSAPVKTEDTKADASISAKLPTSDVAIESNSKEGAPSSESTDSSPSEFVCEEGSNIPSCIQLAGEDASTSNVDTDIAA